MSWAQSLQPRYQVVAEVKTISPFGWEHPRLAGQDSWGRVNVAMALVEELSTWADIISVHTNPLWGGSWGWLETARKLTTKPILAKGFHDTTADVKRAFECGADYVLTVGWWPGDPRCWHEAETLDELADSRAPFAVWNARNPRTGVKRRDDIHLARKVRNLLELGEEHQWLCQASMIRRPEDVHPGVQAVLIGEGL